MKKSYQHIIKKSYTTPKIEEVEIDREMSLVMYTPPVEPEKPIPGNPNAVSGPITKELSTYRSSTYPAATSPFGGDAPEY